MNSRSRSLSDDDDDVDCHQQQQRSCSVSDDEDDDDNTYSDRNDDDIEKMEDVDLVDEKDGSISLRFKCSAFPQDVSIRVRPNDSIAAVKEKVLSKLDDNNKEAAAANNKYVRLIAKGRLLAPDSTLMREFIVPVVAVASTNNNNSSAARLTLRQDDVVHAVLAPRQATQGPQAALQQQRGNTNTNTYSSQNSSSSSVGRGAGINASGLAVRSRPGEFDDEDDDDDDDTSVEPEEPVVDLESGQQRSNTSTTTRRTPERRGFDRLRTAGLRRSEVSAVRAYFSRHVDRFVRQHPEFLEALGATNNLSQNENEMAARDAHGITYAQRRRWLQEEAWMLAQGPTSEFRINLANINVFAANNSNGSGANSIWGNSNSASTNNSNSAAITLTTARSNAAALAQIQQRTAAQGSGASTSSEALWRAGGISAQVGTDRDFCWGFCMGFFVGFFMLVWVWMPTVPHKQKLGILTGISFQLALGMLKGSGSSGQNEDLYDDPYASTEHGHLRGGNGEDVLLVGD